MAKLVAKIETKGAKKSASELEQFSDSAKKADKSTDKLGKTLKKAPKVLAALATAAAANLPSVGVTWGFRDRHELQTAGAAHIIDQPAQLLDLL